MIKKILLIIFVFLNLKAKLIVYIDDYNGGRILYDTVTGLYWQDIPLNSSYMIYWGWCWTSDPQNETKTWWDYFSESATPPIDGANAFCINMPGPNGRLGYWRVPNYNELNSIVDRTRIEPEPAIRKEFENVAKDYYWTSTTYADDTNKAWMINFYYGDDEVDYKTNYHYIRCVH